MNSFAQDREELDGSLFLPLLIRTMLLPIAATEDNRRKAVRAAGLILFTPWLILTALIFALPLMAALLYDCATLLWKLHVNQDRA
jgi:hypothetical protein